jgi:hypothetical protein
VAGISKFPHGERVAQSTVLAPRLADTRLEPDEPELRAWTCFDLTYGGQAEVALITPQAVTPGRMRHGAKAQTCLGSSIVVNPPLGGDNAARWKRTANQGEAHKEA